MVAATGRTRHSIARLLRDEWTQIAPGIYLTRRGEPGFVALAFAATAYAGPGSAVGLRGAAYLHGWVRDPPRALVVWTPRRRELEPWPRVVFRRDSLGREPVLAPPCTDRVDTALDLCAAAPDVDGVVRWLALVAKGSRADRVRRIVAGRPKQPRRRLILAILDEVTEGAESALELRFGRDVLRAHGLPAGRRQVQTRAGRVDMVDEEHGLAYELDGRLGHEGIGAFRDAARDNLNVTSGLTPLRYGWADVAGRPCATAAQITGILRGRGWQGRVRRCPRCP